MSKREWMTEEFLEELRLTFESLSDHLMVGMQRADRNGVQGLELNVSEMTTGSVLLLWFPFSTVGFAGASLISENLVEILSEAVIDLLRSQHE